MNSLSMQSLFQNRLNLGLNLFYIKGDNMIQVTMVGGQAVEYQHRGGGKQGLRDYRRLPGDPSLQLSANYSLLDMTYKIVGGTGT